MIFTEMRLHVYHFNLREILSSLLTRHSHILCVNEVKNFLRGGTAAAAERAKIGKIDVANSLSTIQCAKYGAKSGHYEFFSK